MLLWFLSSNFLHFSVRDGTRKKKVISFARKRANYWLSRSDMKKDHCEAISLLWQYVAMLVQHNGVGTSRM